MKLIILTFSQYLFLWLLFVIANSRGQIGHNGNDLSKENTGSSYFYYQQPKYPRDCQEVLLLCSVTNPGGVFLIKPDGSPEAFEVYCDNSTHGSGWTVFHRRIEGFIDFHHNWSEYKNGFGFLSTEFWLGFEELAFLTNQKKYEIRIDMENAEGALFYIQYNMFRISDDYGEFRLTNLGDYTGTAASFIVQCPTNMHYKTCACQPTCDDPHKSMGCQTTCSEAESCVCQHGFLKKGDDCVPPEECACYTKESGVIPNGQTYVNVGCTRSCQCQSNILTCDNDYGCSSDGMCGEIDDLYQCFCKDEFTGDGRNCTPIGMDCHDIYNAGLSNSGVYSIKPRDWPGSHFQVYCNMANGGGWMVFQRRVNGSEKFYRNWNSYKNGFGTFNHEMWLGNDKIYYITNQRIYQLRIDLVFGAGSSYYAKYNRFRINDENDNYRLIDVGSFTGTADNDRFSPLSNKPFSTYDRDNDGRAGYNCAVGQHGGWWYGDFVLHTTSSCATTEYYCDWWPVGTDSCAGCSHTNLNGDYNGVIRGTNLDWESGSDYDCDITYVEMKIKPV